MIIQEISENLLEGEDEVVMELVYKALEQGISPKEILEEGLMHGMGILGEQFKNGEAYVPEVLVAAQTMSEAAEILLPKMAKGDVTAKGKVVIGTVHGDLHDIGKNLVALMMRGYGLTVTDIGIDVPNERFIEVVKTEKPDVLVLSALLTTTMGAQEEVIQALEQEGLRGTVKIMVGGAPVTETFAQKIGADAYTPDAATAAETAVRLCS